MKLDTKIPPQDIDAEKSVLGSLMIDKEAITKIADILSANDFYSSANNSIYSASIELFNSGEPIDILTVTNILKKNKRLKNIGGSTYLTELINSVPSSAHIENYAKSIREKRILRDLISVSANISDRVFDEGAEVENLIDSIEKEVFAISKISTDKNFSSLSSELSSAYERIEKLHQGDGRLRGVTSGFDGLDNCLSGFQKSDLIILGARPSLGKTTLALDIARNAAKKGGTPVAIFSIEMSKEQIVDRLIAAEAQIPLWKLRSGRLNNETDFELIQNSLDTLSKMPIFIDDTPSPNIIQMRSIARRIQAEHNIGLIVIDYVQLIHPMTNSNNMVQQFTEISHGLKALARELQIPVLALSQLNRAVDQREKRIPRLSDLRETGSWEQDADVVMLINRRRDIDQLESSLENDNTATLIIAKHRNGPTGAIDLVFDPERVTFNERAKENYENQKEQQ